MSKPVHLFRAWDKVKRRLRRAHRRMLLTDFDGTLAPIQRRPELVRLPGRVRQLLSRIARRGDVVAVISGRALDDVSRRTGVRGIWYAGSHGYFLREPGRGRITLLGRAERERMRRAERVLIPQFRQLPGILSESKVATLAIHYRGAPRRSRRAARRILNHWIEREKGFAVLGGKKIWELIPGDGVDKWAAVRFILQRAGARGGAGTAAVFYLGDDITDERVFRRLRGFTVVIGKRDHTAARYYLPSPSHVRSFLERWTEAVQ